MNAEAENPATNGFALDSKIAAIKSLAVSIFNDVRSRNPIDKEHGKYLQFCASVHGYSDDETPELSCYFGDHLNIRLENAAQLESELSNFNPDAVREKRKAELRAELAKLEGKDLTKLNPDGEFEPTK